MRRTFKDFTDSEKAAMLDNIIDEIIKGYDAKLPAKGFKYKSVAEMVGYEILISLNSNGFITSEGIAGK